MIRRTIPIAVGAAVIIALGATTQAVAYPDQGSGSRCSSGSSGAVCAHLETDAGSGHIRARAAATANSGAFIIVTRSELDELTTERATGQQTLTVRAVNSAPKKSTGSTVSVIAGPIVEQCDNALATFQWLAVMNYTTPKGDFGPFDSGWQPGRC